MMTQNSEVLKEIEDFLKDLQISNYEIRVYLALVQVDSLNAKDLSRKADVPTGRIYEVLEQLNESGLIEIQRSRPKLYKAVSPNLAFQKLINHVKMENKKRISTLYDKATTLESKIDKSKLWYKQDPKGVFYTTAFGARPTMDLYVSRVNQLHEELLMTAFLSEDTLRIIPFGKALFSGIFNAVKRGVTVKILWSFEFDGRPLSSTQEENNKKLYYKLLAKLEELYGISPEMKGIEVKFVHKKLPTYSDVLDKNRVIIKLQNPLKPSQVFACLDVLDPNLAGQMRDKYLALWLHDGLQHDGSI